MFSFMTYLTPLDSFTGNVSQDFDQKVEFDSVDDSLLVTTTNGTPDFASTFPIRFRSFVDSSLAYIEVIGLYAVRGQIGTPTGVVNVVSGMSKTELHKIFSSNRQNLIPSTDTLNRVSSVTPQMILLKGKVENSNPINGAKESLDFVALEAGSNSATAGLSTKVVNNPFFDASLHDEVRMGDRFGTSISSTGDNILDIEAAIAAVQKVGYSVGGIDTFPYVNFVFPTKYRHEGKDICGSGSPISGFSAPFQTDGSMRYDIRQIDESGNLDTETSISCPTSPCTNAAPKSSQNVHVAELVDNFKYTRGQSKLQLFEKSGCVYAGAPVLAYNINFSFTSNTVLMQMAPMSTDASGLQIAERIFNWAERTYPEVLKNPTPSRTYTTAAYRCYAGNLCLAERQGRILLVTPAGELNDLGSSSDFLAVARAAGF
jgi:hypothetical protein